MSTSKTSAPDALPSVPENLDVRNALADATGTLTPAVRATAFYLGTALPVVYVPLLVTSATTNPTAIAALIVAHAVSLAIGHEHEPQ